MKGAHRKQAAIGVAIAVFWAWLTPTLAGAAGFT
jgi:hypothetical protein